MDNGARIRLPALSPSLFTCYVRNDVFHRLLTLQRLLSPSQKETCICSIGAGTPAVFFAVYRRGR